MFEIAKHSILKDENIMLAFEMLNNVPGNLTLFVLTKRNRLVGTLTDGDIRRGFLKGLKLSNSVENFMVKDFKSLFREDLNPLKIKELKEAGIKLLPIVDENYTILDVINFNKVATVLPVDAVLMAGGRGERLKPLTDKVPKPMLKIGSKPIIEHNIDNLTKHGIQNFYVSVNYLANQITDYFQNGEIKSIDIKYIKEEKPLGTIGSVSLIKDFKNDAVLIMNADLFTNINCEDFYLDFIRNSADISIASVPYNVSIPYAILEHKDNTVLSFEEKPSYTFYANAGIYLIKKELLKQIPFNSFYNATDFIQQLINKNKKVIKYPIIGYWVDIGRKQDFDKVQEFIKHLEI